MERVVDRDAGGIVLFQQADGVLIEGHRHDQGFPGVPEQRERLTDQAVGEDPLEGPVECGR